MDLMKTIYFEQLDKTIDLQKLKEMLEPYPSDIIFMSGSLVEGTINKNSKGMGNRLSDIDIFIIRLNENFVQNTSIDGTGYDYDTIKVSFKKFMGISVDIGYYPINEMLNIINQLNAIDFDNCEKDKRIRNWITLPNGMLMENFMSFLHRIYNSIPLQNVDKYCEFIKCINFSNYFKYMSLSYILWMDTRYPDVLGNLEIKEYQVAEEGAREVLRKTMAAYLFSRHESIDRDKWIPLKLKNISLVDTVSNRIYCRYVELLFKTSLKSDEDFKKNIEDIINLTEYTVSCIRKTLEF